MLRGKGTNIMKVIKLNNETEDKLICTECGYQVSNIYKLSFSKDKGRYITYRDGDNTAYIGSLLLCNECFHTLMLKIEKELKK